MKTLRPIFAALALLLIAAATQAQQTKVTATIPFDFVVGDHSYPAGQYQISRVFHDEIVLQISDASHTVSANLISDNCMRPTASKNTELVFRRSGDSYFLYQVWTQGNPYGREFSSSPAEKVLAKNHQHLETVTVAANLAR
jgi:hypothetical protein